MNPVKEYYQKQAQVIINNMKKRNFDAYYVEDTNKAKELISELLGDNKSIGYGGSETLRENGFFEYLEAKGHKLIKRENYKTEEQDELKKQLITCDAFFTSSNAITIDGELINIDGACSRIAYLTYGPKEVYIVVGMNKVSLNREEGLSRASNIAAPKNAIRLNCDTPCTKVGKCMNCLDPKTICCNIVITRFSRIKNRIKVILIGEELGY